MRGEVEGNEQRRVVEKGLFEKTPQFEHHHHCCHCLLLDEDPLFSLNLKGFLNKESTSAKWFFLVCRVKFFLVWWVVVEGSSRITTSFLALEAASVVTAQEK